MTTIITYLAICFVIGVLRGVAQEAHKDFCKGKKTRAADVVVPEVIRQHNTMARLAKQYGIR